MRPIVLLFACAAALAGCGNGEEGDVREYRDRVEALCRQSEADSERLAERTGEQIEGIPEYFRGALPIARRGQRQLERVDPPDELADQHERSVELGRRGLRLTEELAAELERGQDPVVVLRRRLPSILTLVDETNALARRMELDDCVVEVVPPDAGQAPS